MLSRDIFWCFKGLKNRGLSVDTIILLPIWWADEQSKIIKQQYNSMTWQKK